MGTRDTVLSVASELGATEAEKNLFLKIMRAESNGQTNARNPNSTATGIFQFLNQTWLSELKAHGAEHGLGHIANQITRGSDGKWHAPQAVLALRNDPEISTRMMYEFTEANRAGLKNILGGREPTAGHLYLAHFAGLGGAREVLEANPAAKLRDLPIMRRALAANPTIKDYTAGQLIAWAHAKMDADVDTRLDYHNASSHTAEETEAERAERIRRLRGLGVSDERIDELSDKDMLGAGFFILLLTVISEIAKTSEKDVAAAMPELAAATRTLPAATRTTEADTGLAAAVAAVSPSLRQQPVAADRAELLPTPPRPNPVASTRAPVRASA